MLPISNHLSMLSQQFLARALQPDYFSHLVATAHPGPRGCKVTLRSAFFTPSFHRFYTDTGTSSGIVPISTCKSAIKIIHTDSVTPPNKVLNARLPSVSAEEQSLSRWYCTTLSRLREGQCPLPSSQQLPSCGRQIPHRPLLTLWHGGPHHQSSLLLSLTFHGPDSLASLESLHRDRRILGEAPVLQPSAAGAPSP